MRPHGGTAVAPDPSSESQIPYSRAMRSYLRHARWWLPVAKAPWPRVRAVVGWSAIAAATVPAIATAIALAIVAALILLPPLIAPELDDAQAQFEVQDRARLTVATIIGGLILLVGLWMNWRRVSALEQQVATAQLGPITERFTRAIDQLGAVRPDNAVAPEIRAGGVRSLERIARESEDDLWPILDILSAYLRSVSRAPDRDHWEELAPQAYDLCSRMDVAFTIEAIARLWPTERTANHRPLDLMGAFVPRVVLAGKHLEGAKLMGAHLEEADLGGSNLEDTSLDRGSLERAFLQAANLRAASLEGAILRDASLWRANLQGAFLQNADLDGAMLWGATLENANVGSASLQNADLGSVDAYGANFRYANLQGANLRRARLVDANLRDADLRNANLWEADLSGASVEGANYGEQTRWPEGFNPPVTPERSD